MLKIYRAVTRFFADCMDALRDDEAVAARFEARQQRWLDYLRS
jgi:hypothetical protein